MEGVAAMAGRVHRLTRVLATLAGPVGVGVTRF